MSKNKNLAILVTFTILVSMVLAACGPTPAPEVVVETVVEKETVVEEKVVGRGDEWEHRINDRHERGIAIDPTDVTALAVTAVDRVGNESELKWISMP